MDGLQARPTFSWLSLLFSLFPPPLLRARFAFGALLEVEYRRGDPGVSEFPSKLVIPDTRLRFSIKRVLRLRVTSMLLVCS